MNFDRAMNDFVDLVIICIAFALVIWCACELLVRFA